MTYECILVETIGKVGLVRLNRPQVLNALNDQLMTELEYYIYSAGYGPTNETLGKYIRELFGQETSKTLPNDPQMKTIVLDAGARSKSPSV